MTIYISRDQRSSEMANIQRSELYNAIDGSLLQRYYSFYLMPRITFLDRIKINYVFIYYIFSITK